MNGISQISFCSNSTYTTQTQRKRRRPQTQNTNSYQETSSQSAKRNPQKELEDILRMRRECRQQPINPDIEAETFERTTDFEEQDDNEPQEGATKDYQAPNLAHILKGLSPYLLVATIATQPFVYGTGILHGTQLAGKNEDYMYPLRKHATIQELSQAYDVPFEIIKEANIHNDLLFAEEIILPNQLVPFQDNIEKLNAKIYSDKVSQSTIDSRVYKMEQAEKYLEEYKKYSKSSSDIKEVKKQVDYSIDVYSSQIYKDGVSRSEGRKVEQKLKELKAKQAELQEKYDFYMDSKYCYFTPKKMMELREVKKDLDVFFSYTLYKQNEKEINPSNAHLDFWGDAIFYKGDVYKIPLNKINID